MSASPPSTVATALLDALKAHGATGIFGIPGDFALPFFKVIEESRTLPLYLLSHEPALGFAADAAARLGTRMGVAAVTYGAGALNLVNAVANAFAEKSPVVVVSGAPGKLESTHGLLLHHQAKTLDSQYRIFAEVTCDQVRLDDARRAPADIARVLRSCLTCSQPVYIELPRDMINAPCEPVTPAPVQPCDPAALAACVDDIAEALRRARSPVIMVGVEVRRFGLESKVADLVNRSGIPVVTSLLGRGLLADEDVPLAGTYIGIAGERRVTELVEGSDALLLLGVILSDGNFGVSRKHIDLRKTIQALDQRVTLGYHTYSDMPLPDVVDALLARELPPRSPPAPVAHAYPCGMPGDDAAIAPNDIAAALNDLIAGGEDVPISADVGDCLFTALDVRNTALVAPAYYATMGFAVPAALGMQAAGGRRPFVLVGDGAFQMTGWELGNCRRYGWDPIVIVFNNRRWEMLHAFQPESAFSDLDDWHFADMASSLGGDGVRVTTRRELQAALARAVRTRGRFQLIEAMIPRGAISSTLERFVAGFKRLSGKEAGA